MKAVFVIPEKIVLSILLAAVLLTVAGCPGASTEKATLKSKVFVNLPIERTGADINFKYDAPETCTIEVEGPSEVIDAMTTDHLSARINVEGLSPGTHGPIKVLYDIPEGITLVSLDPSEVTLNIELSSVEKELKDVVIEITGTSVGLSYDIFPTKCNVLVVGPADLMENVNPQALKAFVDVTGLEIGNYVRDIQVTVLPDGVSLIGTTPGVILMTIDVSRETPA